MGLLVDGKWVDQWYDTKESKGRFERENAQLRSWITKSGEAGPTSHTGRVTVPVLWDLEQKVYCQ